MPRPEGTLLLTALTRLAVSAGTKRAAANIVAGLAAVPGEPAYAVGAEVAGWFPSSPGHHYAVTKVTYFPALRDWLYTLRSLEPPGPTRHPDGAVVPADRLQPWLPSEVT